MESTVGRLRSPWSVYVGDHRHAFQTTTDGAVDLLFTGDGEAFNVSLS